MSSAIVWNTRPVWPLVRTIGSATDPSKFIDRVIAARISSPDGKLLATGGGYPSRIRIEKLWNPADGSAVRTLADAHSDTVCCVRFSPVAGFFGAGATDRTASGIRRASSSLVKTFGGIRIMYSGRRLASPTASNSRPPACGQRRRLEPSERAATND